MRKIKIKQIDQRYHTHVLGLASVAAAFTIVSAGAPYLLAQTDYTQPVADTLLTAPMPLDPVPPSSQTYNQNIPSNYQQPPCQPSANQPCPGPVGQTPSQYNQMLSSGGQFGPGGTGPGEQGQMLPTGAPRPGDKPMMEKPSERGMMPGGPGEGGEGEEMMNPQDFIDPREIQNALQDIKRMSSELKKFIRLAAAIQNNGEIVGQIKELQSKLVDFEKQIKAAKDGDNSTLREVMQEFWEAQPWEEINKIRVKVELPRELKTINKELTRLERLITQKSFQQMGVDMAALKVHLGEMRETYKKIQESLATSDSEEIMEMMEVFHEGGHPGEVSSVLYRLRDLKKLTKSIKDAEVQEQIQGIIDPIIESFDKGDFRDARELMDDSFNELVRLSNVALKIQRRRIGNRDDMIDKFQALEEKIRAKIEKLDDDEAKQELEREKKNKVESRSSEPKPSSPSSSTILTPEQVMPAPAGGTGGPG